MNLAVQVSSENKNILFYKFREQVVKKQTVRSNWKFKRIFTTIVISTFHIAAFSQSPGGVNPDLYLWLKANTGVATTGSNVTSWTNQATTAMVTEASKAATSNVTLLSGAINYNPAVVFDGVSNQMLQGQYTTAPANPSLFFAVVKKNNAAVGCCTNPFALGPGGAAGIAYSTAGVDQYGVDGSGFGCSNTINGINKLGIVRVDYNSVTSSAGAIAAFNGTVSSACGAGPVITPNGIFQVGGRTFGSLPNRIFAGSIAEVIHYNSNTVTATDVKKIESYLAIKYGITLSTNYLSADLTTIYDVSTYNNGIIGISRDDNSSQLQKQSHQEDDSTRIYLSTLATTNDLNTGNFSSNNQDVVMGHNNSPLKSLGSVEYPGGLGIFSRIEREWKITNTNFDGSFSIDIKLNTSPITASDLRILIDTDGDFSNATMFAPTISYSGGIVTISGLSTAQIPTNSTRFLTLVSLNKQTPLPVELVYFSAIPEDNRTVKLEWQTASESRNNIFTVERSVNGFDWEIIKIVEGSLHSNILLNYSAIDNSPYSGISYYRLKQTDVDGEFNYSQIKSVNLKHFTNESIVIYPNPSNNQIRVIGNISELSDVRVFNSLGQDVSNLTTINTIDESAKIIDISQLAHGIYYIKTKTTANSVYKK